MLEPNLHTGGLISEQEPILPTPRPSYVSPPSPAFVHKNTFDYKIRTPDYEWIKQIEAFFLKYHCKKIGDRSRFYMESCLLKMLISNPTFKNTAWAYKIICWPNMTCVRPEPHFLQSYFQNDQAGEFPGGAVVKNLPANAGDARSIPGPQRSHMPWSN